MSSELKALQRRRNEAAKELESQKEAIKEEQRELTRKQAELAKLELQLSQLTDKEPIVSEHALLRYIERYLGADLEAIRERILTPELTERINSFPNGRFEIGGGFVAVVRDKVITTIKPKHRDIPKPPRIREQDYGEVVLD